MCCPQTARGGICLSRRDSLLQAPALLLAPGRRPHIHSGCDHLLRGNVPFPGERDVREQPGQPCQRLAVRGIRHQAIATSSRMTSGYDIPPPLSPLQPAHAAAPRPRSPRSPRRRGGAPARPAARNRVATRPPLSCRPSAAAPAVTTGRQNTASSPADGTTFPAVTVSPGQGDGQARAGPPATSRSLSAIEEAGRTAVRAPGKAQCPS
jgi:hypothetical protein